MKEKQHIHEKNVSSVVSRMKSEQTELEGSYTIHDKHELALCLSNGLRCSVKIKRRNNPTEKTVS